MFACNEANDALRQIVRNLAIRRLDAKLDRLQLLAQLLSRHTQCFCHLHEAHEKKSKKVRPKPSRLARREKGNDPMGDTELKRRRYDFLLIILL
jgi:hypothetical protein